MSGNTDMLLAMHMIFYQRVTSSYLYLESMYDAHPAVKVLYMAFLLCGGNDFMPVYVEGCHRTNVSSEDMRVTVADLLEKAAAGPVEEVPSLDAVFKMVKATRAQQQQVVFALIFYLDGACYVEGGSVRRMFEATCELGMERACREAIARMNVVQAAAVYPAVEAVVAAITASPDALDKVKRVVAELTASLSPKKALPFRARVDLECARVAGMRKNTLDAFRRLADALDVEDATAFAALVVNPKAEAALRDYAEATRRHAGDGPSGERGAEAALRSLRRLGREEMERLMGLRACAVDALGHLQRFEKECIGGPDICAALQTLQSVGCAVADSVLKRLSVEDRGTLSRALVSIVREALLAEAQSVPGVLKTLERTAVGVWKSLDAEGTPTNGVGPARGLVIFAAALATQHRTPLKAALRDLDALRWAFHNRGDVADACAAIAARLDAAVSAGVSAVVPLVSDALDALGRDGANGAKPRFTIAETAADVARRGLRKPGAHLTRARAMATQPRTLLGAARRDAGALGVLFGDVPGAGEALALLLARYETATNVASVELEEPLVAVLVALARSDAEARLDDAEAAAGGACWGLRALVDLLAWAAAVATRPRSSYRSHGISRCSAARRSLDALDGTLAGAPGRAEAVAAVTARFDSLVAAAPLVAAPFVVAALNALASGDPGVAKVRLDDAEAATDRDIGALGAQLSRAAASLEHARAAPGAARHHLGMPPALSADIGDENVEPASAQYLAAANAASSAVRPSLLAALGALAAGNRDLATKKLDAADAVLRGVQRLQKEIKNQRRAASAAAQWERERAERAVAARSGGGAVVDRVTQWQAAIKSPAPAAGVNRNQCVMVRLEVMPPAPERAVGEAPEFEKCANFGRHAVKGSKTGGNNCAMCGRPNKGILTSQNVDGVPIGYQMKDICNHCIGQPWRHGVTGYSLRFCKGSKNFHHIHAFERADDEKK